MDLGNELGTLDVVHSSTGRSQYEEGGEVFGNQPLTLPGGAAGLGWWEPHREWD